MSLQGGGEAGAARRAFVASFGFDEKFVVRALLRHRLARGDEIILVTGRPTDKTVKAYESVKGIASSVGARVTIKTLNNTVYDFISAVNELKSMLTSLTATNDEVIVVLSGGMRVIVLALYTAVLLSSEKVKNKLKVELDTEDEGALITIPAELLKLLNPVDIGAAKREVLQKILENPGVDVVRLAQLTGKDESTVRRQLQKLQELGLIRVEGKPQKIYPLEHAKLLL